VKSKVLFERKTEDPARKTLYGLLLGIGVLGFLMELVFLAVCEKRMAYTIGLCLGLWVSVINSIYIYRSLGRVLELDEEASVKAMRGPVVVRFVLMGIAAATGFLYPDICAPIGVICGLFTLKISAYLQALFIKPNPDAKPIPEEEWEEDEEDASQWGFGVFHHPASVKTKWFSSKRNH